MVAIRAALLCSLLAGALLAGCSGGGDPPADKPDDEAFDELALTASDSTGVLRGVVVDDAIRPVANANVTLSGTGTGSTKSTADGLFGFSDLQPGPYFIHVEKPGFVPAQASAEVVAGLAEPDIVKVLLSGDPSTLPYFATYVFDGYIECSFSLVAVGFAACSSVSTLNDRFSDTYELDRLPDWAQSEMVWESTQAVSESLRVVYSVPPRDSGTTLYENYAQAGGPSPLTITANQTTMAAYGVLEQGLIFRVFNEPIDGTTPPDPVGGDDCLDRPQLGGCATGVGFTLEQSFQIYTTVFYGFVPEDGWLFTVDGPHPLPA